MISQILASIEQRQKPDLSGNHDSKALAGVRATNVKAVTI